MPRRSRHLTTLQFLRDRYVGDDPKRLAALEGERLNARIAREIYDLRTAAGLTQRQLASRAGTTASVICQLEDSDYSGRSLSLLRRVASALSARVDLRLVPLVRRRVAGSVRRSRIA